MSEFINVSTLNKFLIIHLKPLPGLCFRNRHFGNMDPGFYCTRVKKSSFIILATVYIISHLCINPAHVGSFIPTKQKPLSPLSNRKTKYGWRKAKSKLM